MTKTELDCLISKEKKLYLGDAPSKVKQRKRSKHKRYYIFMYLYYFRLCQFYHDIRFNKKASRFQRSIAKYKFKYYDRKKNIFSYKSGVEIGLNSSIGQCCDIYHSGVVINGKIGDNCVFHGNNTVGNKGIGMEQSTPVIGDNVDVGVGAVIIGDVYIANNSVVGAGAVVTRRFTEEKSIIVGVPGKQMGKAE